MIEQYISFETAKLAKEKGFDYRVYGMYRGQDTYWTNDGTKCVCGFDEELDDWEDEVERIYKWLTPRPTQSLLQKWLREEHNIFIEVQLDQTSTPKFAVEIFQYKGIGDFAQLKQKDWSLYRTYEEALEHGLLEALKLI